MTPKQCGLYVRVSTDRQASKEFSSLETQEDLLRDFVKEKDTNRAPGEPRWTIAKVYREAKSAKDTNRPAFQQMLGDVRAGQVNMIVFISLDRFSRSLRDFLNVQDLLHDHGCGFVSLRNRELDTSSPHAELMTRLLLMLAEHERKLTGIRVKEKMAWLASQGLWNSGHVLGYDLDPKRRGVLVPNETETRLVQEIFQTYLETRSVLKVARRLNEKGHRTKSYSSRRGSRHTGRPFTKNAVRHVLGNPVYVGKVTYKREIYEGRHPGIIEPKLWEEANRLLKANTVRRGKPSHRGSRDHLFLVEGLAYCSRCGGLLVPTYSATRGVKRFYYRCCRKYNGSVDCAEPAVPAEQFEHIVAERIRRIARNQDVFLEAMRQARETGSDRLGELQSKKPALGEELRKIDDHIQNVVSFVRSATAPDGSNSRALAAELERLERQKMSLQKELEDLTAQIRDEKARVVNKDLVRDSCAFFDTVFDLMTAGEKRELILTFVSSITYASDKIRIELFSAPIPREQLARAGDVKQSCSLSRPEMYARWDSNPRPAV